jgi:hypothetical protein
MLIIFYNTNFSKSFHSPFHPFATSLFNYDIFNFSWKIWCKQFQKKHTSNYLTNCGIILKIITWDLLIFLKMLNVDYAEVNKLIRVLFQTSPLPRRGGGGGGISHKMCSVICTSNKLTLVDSIMCKLSE